MMAKTRERFDIGDRQRELRDEGTVSNAASLAGWVIVLALLLMLMVAG